jgi:hypothetical protein
VGRVWGFKTWRGVTEPLPRRIPGVHRKQWRILLEPGTQLGPSKDNCWTAPEVTLTSDPKLSTQLPEDLPGANAAAWPYPWGKLGTRNFPVSEVTRMLQEEEAEAEAQMREEIAAQMEEDRFDFLDAPQVVVEVDAEGRLIESFDDSEADEMEEAGKRGQVEEGEEGAKALGAEADVDADEEVEVDLKEQGDVVPLFDLDSIQFVRTKRAATDDALDALDGDEDADFDALDADADAAGAAEANIKRIEEEFDEEEETMQELDDAADAEEEAERKDDAKREAEAKKKKPTTQ